MFRGRIIWYAYRKVSSELLVLEMVTLVHIGVVFLLSNSRLPFSCTGTRYDRGRLDLHALSSVSGKGGTLCSVTPLYLEYRLLLSTTCIRAGIRRFVCCVCCALLGFHSIV